MTQPLSQQPRRSPAQGTAPAPASLRSRYRDVRRATEALAALLSPEDCTVQSMPDVSPTKWHLAHTAWFFETLVLEREDPDFRAFHADYRVLFNSYYETVGAQHPRPARGLVSRPGLAEVLRYRAHVDEGLDRFLTRHGDHPVVELGLQHERQHQELLLTDIKHVFSCNPTRPAYREMPVMPASDPGPVAWLRFEGGLVPVGFEGTGFAFDNERPRHRAYLEPFEITSHPVTNGEFLAFMADDGYGRSDLWLADARAVIQERGWRAPLYWEQIDGSWGSLTLSGFRAIDPHEPVCHVSYYEADAFARWSGVRLPGEEEWEHAAGARPVAGNFVEAGRLHPGASEDTASDGLHQMYGDVWEWTRSPYSPYPGFQPLSGSLGEYNGKFMCSQMVLRGGSCTSPASHLRPTYRNFFYPDQRWQFSGLRLARDAG
jgi:ergothioneine biosynthesis protein EgtB